MDTTAGITVFPPWVLDSLKTRSGTEETLRYAHDNREPGFPPIHLLTAPHPLRPEGFTKENPRYSETHFRDFVVPIRKNVEFMKHWQGVGENTDTPSNNSSVNCGQGMGCRVALGLELTFI